MSINTGQAYPETPVSYSRKSHPAVSVDGLFKAGAIWVMIGIFTPIWLPLLGSVMSYLPAPKVTVEKLVQQARGEKFYWHTKGQAWSTLHALTTRHPKRRAREDAIKKLSEFRPLPVNARNALIDLLLNSGSDFDSGDGIYPLRSTICSVLGHSAHHWSAYEAMLKVLKERATNPELDSESDIKWFDKSWGHYGDDYTGPGGIVRGLRFAPVDQHAEIAKKLEALLEELKSTPVRSDWAISEIESGLKYLNSDVKRKEWEIEWEIERYCVSSW